jgi:hypothetical protein
VPGIFTPDATELARVAAEARATGERIEAPSAAATDAQEEALISKAEAIASGDLKTIQELEDMTADELADFFELGFGLTADFRGKHWEMERKAALRLGRWFKRVLDRHKGDWEAILRWAPEIFTSLLLSYEVIKRYRVDRELKAEAEKSKGASA